MEIVLSLCAAALLIGLGYMISAYHSLRAKVDSDGKVLSRENARRDQLMLEMKLELEQCGTRVLTLDDAVSRLEGGRLLSPAGAPLQPEATPPSSPPLLGAGPGTPRPIKPDVAALLVRSLAGGERGQRDASPRAAVISGAQEELALVAEMLLGIDTKFREGWPEPPAIGNVLMALSDRMLAGLELLSHERGVGPPPPPKADDDEPPPSSDQGGGPLPH